jgi:hypothetical protein
LIGTRLEPWWSDRCFLWRLSISDVLKYSTPWIDDDKIIHSHVPKQTNSTEIDSEVILEMVEIDDTIQIPV